MLHKNNNIVAKKLVFFAFCKVFYVYSLHSSTSVGAQNKVFCF